jgi:hypothetical protein
MRRRVRGILRTRYVITGCYCPGDLCVSDSPAMGVRVALGRASGICEMDPFTVLVLRARGFAVQN